jgi:hypothetical protein
MNYMQAISDFFKTGEFTSGVTFEESMKQILEKERQDLESEGLIMFMEPQGDVVETVEDLQENRRMVKYIGSFVQGYTKDGVLQLTKSGSPCEDYTKAIKPGKMFFVVDATGVVLSWYNPINGKIIGKWDFLAYMPKKDKQLFITIVVLMVLFVLWKLFGGLLF